MSEIKTIFISNPQFYSQNENTNWEDNILWTFLLYENQKKQKSPWYLMIQNLSKEIDYLIFWSEEDLKLLEDDYILKKA